MCVLLWQKAMFLWSLPCRWGSSEETPPHGPRSWMLQMSPVFWGDNYGESLMDFISSVSQEHFKATYSCKAVWPWVQVLCPWQLCVSCCAHRAVPLCCLMSPLSWNWGWCGWEMSWGLALCSSQSRALRWGEGCGDGMGMAPRVLLLPWGAGTAQLQVVLPVPPQKPKEWKTFLGQLFF